MNELVITLVRMMHEGIVEFTFLKKDGTIRDARGTLRHDMCPPTKGSGRRLGEHLQVYYDLDKKEYRCFKKDNLIKIK